ncbi:MAG TPA: sigma-70 family RNA polymerase sigma factor [Steroidobacteraceae bacterium]|jgi:RNA polymerase sigma-70 factor (ECF subfamily)|nr:sigma-70 family RNA polymerase sigma factor [Steroidobacteraceae bacterium]
MTPPDSDTRAELDRLLQQCGRGDQGAFAELYRRTSPRLFALCLRMLRDRGTAEDVLQDSFVTVWRRASTFDATRGSAISWLITLTRNRAIDRLRAQRETALDPLTTLDYAAGKAVEDSTGDGLSPAAAAEGTQESGRLQRCLEELDPHPQRSIREAFFSGATYNELARRSNVPLGTMKSWIRRGLLQLRKCLEQ